jgi:hypothetical protein
MAVKLKLLFNDELSSGAGGTVKQLDENKTASWLIKNIYFYNRHATAITLDLYLSQAGGASTYLYKGYSIAAGAELFVNREITLNHTGTADKITARCVNAASSKLDCVINGIERDQ